MARLVYPFQPHVIDNLPNDLTQLYRDLESQLLEGICSRIHAAGEMNEVTLQNIRALRSHGLDLSEIEQAIQQTGGISNQKMQQLFSDVIARNQGYFSRLINMAGLTEPETLVDAATLDAIQRQAQNGVLNLTRSMGFLVNNGQTMLQPAKAYQWALDNAMLKVQSGAWSYNDAIWDAVRQLADSGLRAVDYENGSVSALDVAVRRAVMTGVNQINQKYRDQSAEFLQTDLVEVTAHLGARNVKGPKGWEAHSEWQGKVYQKGKTKPGGKYPSFETKCGYGDVQGIGGANCRHSYWPFVEGVSERTYTDEELEAMKPENRPKIQYDGKEYDDYQATQFQRRLENAYRKTKRREIAAKAVGDDKHAAAARARRIALSRKYTDFSAAAGLPEQRERMKVYWPQGQQATGGNTGTAPKPAPAAPTGTVAPKNFTGTMQQGLQSGGLGGTISSGATLSSVFHSSISPTGNIPAEDIFKNIPITEESINSVQEIYPFDDTTKEQAEKLVGIHKDLLRDAAKVNLGKEISRTYLPNGSYLPGITSESGSSRPDFNTGGKKCFIVHNHPGGEHVSVEDLILLIVHKNVIGVSAVGNNGYVSSITKNRELREEEIADLKKYLVNKKHQIDLIGSNMQLSDKECFEKALEITFDAIEEVAKYGIRFDGGRR